MKRERVSNQMKDISIVFASDHAGFQLKTFLFNYLKELIQRSDFSRVGPVGRIEDVGCVSDNPCDYPDFAHQACRKIGKEFDFAVLVCGTGQGMAMTANTYESCRAGVAWNVEVAKAMRSHNDANVLCLPSRHLSPTEAVEVLEAFLKTSFSTEPRHGHRVKKIKSYNLVLSDLYNRVLADIRSTQPSDVEINQ